MLQTVITHFGTIHLTENDRINGNKVVSLSCILVRGQRLRYASWRIAICVGMLSELTDSRSSAIVLCTSGSRSLSPPYPIL